MAETRRAFLRSMAAASASVLMSPSLFSLGSVVARTRGTRPNIVLILADDMGYSDIGCMGSEIPTPNIDKLAAEGILFKNFYNCAKCVPTRGSLLTGLHPHSSGTDRNGGGLSDANPVVTIAEVLKTAGYATGMAGKWHLQADPFARGFDKGFIFLGGALSDYWSPDDVVIEGKPWKNSAVDFHFTDGVTDYAVDFINKQSAATPFFLYTAYTAPHWSRKGLIGQARPDDAQPFKDIYKAGYDAVRQQRYDRLIAKGLFRPEWKMSPNEAEPWDSLGADAKAESAEEMANHAGLIVQMDRGIGKILSTLERKGLDDNTLVLFLSDNGASAGSRGFGPGWANTSCTPFKKYKKHVHEGGIGTPLLARWPAIIPAHGVSERAGHIVDIMATCVEISGAHYPAHYKGKSIPPCQGKSLTSAFQGLPDGGHDYLCWEFLGKMAVHKGNWKAIGQSGYWKELYNLETDRNETNNLVDKESQKLSELKSLYDEWWKNNWIVDTHATATRTTPSTRQVRLSRHVRLRYGRQRTGGMVYSITGAHLPQSDLHSHCVNITMEVRK